MDAAVADLLAMDADKQMFPSLVMSPELSGHQDLPDFLKANTAAILKSWVDITRPQLSSKPLRQLSFEEFRDNVPKALAHLAELLEDRADPERSSGFKESASQHGHRRWRQGFNLKDLIRDWGNLQQVVLKWVNHYYEGETKAAGMDRATAVESIVAFFTDAVCDSVARFDALRRDEAVRTGKELERMRQRINQIVNLRKQALEDLSHDMRSPLAAISGVSSMLKTEENEQEHEELYELGSIIDESVAGATELLNHLQELSHIDAGLAELALSSVDVAALLREVVGERRAVSSGGDADCGGFALTAPESLWVEADAAKLRKTFEGLLKFAQPYPPDEAAELPRAYLTLRPMEDGWGLQLRHSPSDSSLPAGRDAAHESVNALILQRLCLIQFAGFKTETADSGEQILTLKFPLDYGKAEQPAS